MPRPLSATVQEPSGLSVTDTVGVVYDPIRDELFSAIAGRDAELNGRPLTPGDPGDLGHALISTGFGYDPERRRLQVEEAAAVIPAARDIRRCGSAALDLAWCAAGRSDGYWERGVQRWDIAAGEVVCAAAGRTVGRLEPMGQLPACTLVAAPSVAPELRARVR